MLRRFFKPPLCMVLICWFVAIENHLLGVAKRFHFDSFGGAAGGAQAAADAVIRVEQHGTGCAPIFGLPLDPGSHIFCTTDF